MRYSKILSAILCVFCIFSTFFVNAAAENKIDINRDYDVVFVMDASDSMNNSDPHKLAFEAVKLFVNKLPASTTRFGIVVYTDEIVKELALTSDKGTVESFVNSVKYVSKNNKPKTDIPLGLTEATSLLKNSNDNKGKVIILLTDGKVESSRKQSVLDKEIKEAEKSGNKIFTIGINGNGTAQTNKKYLSGIADATDGECYIVKTSDELLKIFNEIYIENNDGNSELTEVRDNGEFDVNENVVEAIVEIYHDGKIGWELVSPGGEKFSAATNEITIKEYDYSTAISIFCPAEGTWKINISKDASNSTDIQPTCILNYNLTLKVGLDNTEVGQGSIINISAEALDSQKKITDKLEFFKRYNCSASIKDSNGQVVADAIALNADKDGYSAQYTIPDDMADGTYTVTGIINGTRLVNKESSNIAELKVGSNFPVVGGTTKPGTTGTGSEKNSWLIYLIIGIGVVLIAAIAFVVWRLTHKGERIGGTIEYEWKILETNDMSQPFSLKNFNQDQIKKITLQQLLENRPEFAFAANIIIAGEKNENKIPVNVLINNASADITILKDGIPVSIGSKVVLETGSQVSVMSQTPQTVEIKLNVK